VFFRDTCRREAVRRGVHGWVRNRSDGAVEAAFEGPGDAVRAMCAWCETGPPHARVERVSVSEEAPQGESDFRVRP
jgi:acylphosphatase